MTAEELAKVAERYPLSPTVARLSLQNDNDHADRPVRARKRPKPTPGLLAGDPGPDALVESDRGDGALGKGQIQTRTAKRVFVRLTSVRKRLLDEDNLCEKYHVDCCRYAGLIPGDSPATTRIQVAQRKADPGEAEHVVVEIWQER